MTNWPAGARLFILVAVVASGAVSIAQAGSGRVHGQVIDPTGAVIPNAEITVKNATGQTFSAKSDAIGTYTVKDLPPGKYTISVDEKGFAPYSQEVDLVSGQEKKLNITLEIAVQEQHIDVQGDAARVNVAPDNNASSVVISGKDLDALSDDPDELQSELQALAGPSAGPNGGQIYIDGFTGGQLPPKSSIREIRINQNPFSAQYDRMGFGRIEILTKPGTDKVHGQFLFNDNHSFLDAKNPFAGAEGDFDTQMFNGNVGGPLGKKVSYLVSMERRNINDIAVISQQALAVAPGQVASFLPNPHVRTNVSPRIDYQLTANNTLTMRYQFVRDTQDNAGVGQLALPSYAFNSNLTEHTVQISDTQVLGAKAVNETRFEYERTSNDRNALNAGPAIIVQDTFTGGGNPIGISGSTSDHYELQNYTSINRGTHFLRLGGRLRATSESSTSTQNFNGTYIFSSLQDFTAGKPGQFSLVIGQPNVSNTFVDAGLYAEDDWRLRPNMTLSYGLRYETQNDIQDHADWAPRIGFAWGVGGGKKNAAPRTVIRTGFGIFYDRVGQDVALQVLRQ
ncbi:MAG TPA: carboxypeptidase regulatory-like domain-containing protein, partial [Candidatus Angelobacter sp.]|nr:carboxypeptidase regulatory-like domain-containing protein [Candidatus Angelobacter sp.]